MELLSLMEPLCKKSQQLKAVTYFRKKLPHRGLTGNAFPIKHTRKDLFLIMTVSIKWIIKYDEENEKWKELSSCLKNQTENWMQWSHEYGDRILSILSSAHQ